MHARLPFISVKLLFTARYIIGVLYLCSSGIMDCRLFGFENRVFAHALKAASVVWYHSLPLMNSFKKTEAATFPMQAMLYKDNSFLSDYYPPPMK